jgi:hypothetical protein
MKTFNNVGVCIFRGSLTGNYPSPKSLELLQEYPFDYLFDDNGKEYRVFASERPLHFSEEEFKDMFRTKESS